MTINVCGPKSKLSHFDTFDTIQCLLSPPLFWPKFVWKGLLTIRNARIILFLLLLLKSIFDQNPRLHHSQDGSAYPGAATLSITTFSITTLSIMTFNIKGLYVTFSKMTLHKRLISDIQHNDTQHNDTLPLCWISL